SRFFATLNWAPASRIFKRRSVDWATERPWLRVMTTSPVSLKTFFSSATRSAFCERSMPYSQKFRPPDHPAHGLEPWKIHVSEMSGGWIERRWPGPAHDRDDKATRS